MKEIWKDIEGYEGLYQISNLGRIKSLKRMMKNRKCEEIIKSPSKSEKGYLRIALCKNGKIKYVSVHRLVANAFIPNLQNKPCVNHKDCDTSNNNVNNLEWCTYKENNSYLNHHLKRNISATIHYLKRDYPNKEDLIKKAEKLRQEIYSL